MSNDLGTGAARVVRVEVRTGLLWPSMAMTGLGEFTVRKS